MKKYISNRSWKALRLIYTLINVYNESMLYLCICIMYVYVYSVQLYIHFALCNPVCTRILINLAWTVNCKGFRLLCKCIWNWWAGGVFFEWRGVEIFLVIQVQFIIGLSCSVVWVLKSDWCAIAAKPHSGVRYRRLTKYRKHFAWCDFKAKWKH